MQQNSLVDVEIAIKNRPSIRRRRVSSPSALCATSHSVMLVEASNTCKELADDQPLTVSNEVLALAVNMNQARGTYAELCQLTTHEETAALVGWNCDS